MRCVEFHELYTRFMREVVKQIIIITIIISFLSVAVAAKYRERKKKRWRIEEKERLNLNRIFFTYLMIFITDIFT